MLSTSAPPSSDALAGNFPPRTANPTAGLYRSGVAAAVFNLLDPIPFGCFVTACIFDIVYAKSGEIMWVKSAAWLIAIGLLFAVLPRLINLVEVWFRGGRPRPAGEMAAFWLNLLAIVTAIVNAFVHSRDAYAMVPEGVWLSALTVVLLVVANVALTLQRFNAKVAP